MNDQAVGLFTGDGKTALDNVDDPISSGRGQRQCNSGEYETEEWTMNETGGALDQMEAETIVHACENHAMRRREGMGSWTRRRRETAASEKGDSERHDKSG